MPHEFLFLVMRCRNVRSSREVLSNRVCSLHSHIITAHVMMERREGRWGAGEGRSLKHKFTAFLLKQMWKRYVYTVHVYVYFKSLFTSVLVLNCYTSLAGSPDFAE